MIGRHIMHIFADNCLEPSEYTVFWVRNKKTRILTGIYVWDNNAYFVNQQFIVTSVVPMKLSALAQAMVPLYCNSYTEIMKLKNFDNTLLMKECL